MKRVFSFSSKPEELHDDDDDGPGGGSGSALWACGRVGCREVSLPLPHFRIDVVCAAAAAAVLLLLLLLLFACLSTRHFN